MRLERKRINQNYIPISVDEIEVDVVVPFDIYIKRLNGYVVIIEAGKTISKTLKAKIESIGMIYIQKVMLDEYSKYTKNHHKNESALKQKFTVIEVDESLDRECRQLRLFIASDVSNKEKVEAALMCGYSLIKVCYDTDINELILELIDIYSKTFIYICKSHAINLKQFVSLMKDSNNSEIHAVNVAIISIYLAHTLEFSDEDLFCIFQAGLLHDIGNKLMDENILYEHGELSDEQFKAIKKHPELGLAVVKEAGITDENILEGILYHHENLDGSGYPSALKGAEIPKIAQIIAVSDVFNALTMERSYRAGYSSFNALKILKLKMKDEFNMKYINVLIKMLH